MSSIFYQADQDKVTGSNITTRRALTNANRKMAHVADPYGSLLLESILSRDEAKDVITMLDLADELDGAKTLPGFFTSTQMGKREPRHRLSSPPLSPVLPGGPDERDYNKTHTERSIGASEKSIDSQDNKDSYLRLLSEGNIYNLLKDEGDGPMFACRADLGTSQRGRHEECLDGLDTPKVIDLGEQIHDGDQIGGGGADPGPLTQRPGDETKTITETGAAITPEHNRGTVPAGGCGDTELNGSNVASEGEVGGSTQGSDNDDTDVEDGEASVPGALDKRAGMYLVPEVAAQRLARIDDLLDQFNCDSKRLNNTVKTLEDSLEFSHKEITDLKKENADLKNLIRNLDTEDRRTQFQVKDVADKLDRLDSVTKKKNLVFEGIPEGKKEVTDKIICDLFDRLNLNKGIYFEACYRVGPYMEARSRPILVSFERQVDRDMIYARRMELKLLDGYQKVWINEDISPASKRRREMIRLISREAQQQGIDCKTGKYAIHLNKAKYDESNLEDLPVPLRPSSLKQVQIDQNTIAYQSEHAPFSNFYPSQITIGQHKFFCAEQAIQFLRARTLNKPLAATRIYLSRDVRFIKQVGGELGTSKEWDACKFDYMYICLKKKFKQNPELKELLLSTGDLKLVEATPDRLWGCGATLSSNVLRRHTWAGQNKHGQILMTIREEFRRETHH